MTCGIHPKTVFKSAFDEIRATSRRDKRTNETQLVLSSSVDWSGVGQRLPARARAGLSTARLPTAGLPTTAAIAIPAARGRGEYRGAERRELHGRAQGSVR